jgi:ABC-type branched-subunit amino acid transport system ATPase component
MNIKRGEIVLNNLQIKSLEKAKKLAKALTVIEEECGIYEVRITIDNLFICPWIDLDKLCTTEMEKLLLELFNKQK